MAYLYYTQNNFKSMGGIGTSTSIDFAKNKYNNTLYNTLKSQHSNYSTFQNTFGINSLKEEITYNIIKLQYTLVSDFLSKANLSYTLKYLNNEIKSLLNPASPFPPEEISKLIPINNNLDINSQSNSLKKNLFLDTIKSTYLYNLVTSKSNLLKKEKEVQTDDIIDINTNINIEDNTNSVKKNNFLSSKMREINERELIQDIDTQLKKIDKKYSQKLNNDNLLSQSKLIDTKFIKYKNDLENKYKEDLKNEIARIKSVEISKVLLEENQKYLEKIEKMRNEYESHYELKYKELNDKEKEIKEKGKVIQEEYREKTVQLMEGFQKKMNDLYTKESDFNKKCIKELKNIKEKKIDLDKKERELFILKKDYDKELNNEIEKIKNEFKKILKEQIEKLKYENEQELEKVKNKYKLRMLNYDLSIFKDVNDKSLETDIKEIITIKEEISNLVKKTNKSNKNNLFIIDNDFEKIQTNLNYYEQLSNLELKLFQITNKSKYKLYNNKEENEKNMDNIFVKDEKIRNKIEELEKEENELNDIFEKDFNNIINEDISKIELNKEELDKIQTNKNKILLYNLAKEKELNNMYKEMQEKENVLNKIKYIEEINQNIKEAYDKETSKQNYIIIDENEMEHNKNLFLKLYRQKREQQKIDEINKQKERIRQRELRDKEIKEKEREREEEKRQKSKDKKEEEKNIFSKSVILPPVQSKKDRKSSVFNNISDLISYKNEKDKEKEKEKEKEDKKKINEEDEDEYGSGDFVDISKEEKEKSKTKSKLDTSKKEEKKEDEEDLSGKIDMILNETQTDKITEENVKESSESYNDFETSNALEKQGINSINTEQDKDKDKKSNENSGNSSEDYKF